MTVPIVKVERPLDLIGVDNGRLDAALLVPVGPSGQLHHLAARAWLAMCAAARTAGFALTYTYGGTYRSYEQQEALFRSRYAVGGTFGGCKVWNGQTWCKKLVNGKVPATAAVPGTSNHGLGIAVDAALDSDVSDGVGPDDAVSIAPALDWLLANAARFGFSWELVDEPWHLRYVTGDRIPDAVLAYEAGSTPPPPSPPQPSEQEPMILIQVPGDPAQFILNGIEASTAVSEQVIADLKAIGVLSPGAAKQIDRRALKALRLVGPAPDYSGVGPGWPGRTTPADFGSWVP